MLRLILLTALTLVAFASNSLLARAALSAGQNGVAIDAAGNTKLMLWKIDELIEYVSKYFTLKIGDIIFTGTPAGVGKVVANDKLKGYIENKELFSIIVK